ncbi:hypothetical protein [Methanosphaera cuniculi]|uniref:hypothetical protein n=1 Tax=Methanosphaera cuniculi TaxID=1077256 RepID=UPI0026DDC5D0|nr:hypothetical protein [Methanosphaera cuniculi]
MSDEKNTQQPIEDEEVVEVEENNQPELDNTPKDEDETNIFQEEKQLFELTEDITFQDLNEEQQDELIEQLNPNLYDLYIYDADIDPQILEKYEVGQYLYQPSDIYTTRLLTDPIRNTRYAILSKEFQQIPDDELVEEYQDIDLSVSGVLNCFKIVSIELDEELMLITLLHYNSFEELVLKDHMTEIEEKASKMADDMIQTHEYIETDINLEPINYKIPTAIGINNRESGLKPYTKGQLIFYLSVLSAIYEKKGLEDVFAFTDEYDIANIINIYQNSVDELKNIDIVDDDEYDLEKLKISQAYVNTIINSLELSEQLEPEELKGRISKNFEKKDAKEQMVEISNILDISEDKLRELINLK